jgi:phosphoglycerate kinase
MIRSIEHVDVRGKRLLIRVDYNVPLEGGRITDDNRIRAGLPTLEHALVRGASLVVCSHLGAPKGKVVAELSMKPLAARLAELLGREVGLAPDCVGPEVEALAAKLQPGQVLMLENLRFHAEEEGKTPEKRGDFGAKLAALGDIYVNDAFAVCHRDNASVVDAPRHARLCCAGLLLQKEWKYLGEALAEPKRPFVAVSGGAKVSSKIGVLQNLLAKVDHLIIGGAMANTFLLAQGRNMGKSLVEPELVDTAKEILARAKEKNATVHLPVDLVWGFDPKDEKAGGTCGVDELPADAVALDIGPKSLEAFGKVLSQAATVVWNGPVGLFENPAFAAGSLGICRAIAMLHALTIVGGGDTDAVVLESGLAGKMSFVSTAGGAFLEFLEGKELPALKALKECFAK